MVKTLSGLTQNKQCLWNIYIPRHDNDGNKFEVEYLCDWVMNVLDKSGGCTIYSDVCGVFMTDNLFIDINVPIMLIATVDDMMQLALEAKTKFKQESIMFYKVSDEVYFN